MTIISVVLLGLGALLIVSGIECVSIAQTFQQIVANQPLDLSGTAPCGGSGNANSAGTVKPTNGVCPPGYYGPVGGICITTNPAQ